MRWKRTLAGVTLVGAMLFAFAQPALAQTGTGEPSADVLKLGQQMNLLWIVIGAVL